MRYYISDLHFFHEKLNHMMDRRGFESAEAMNAYMIRQWNKHIRNNDDVVILGDFSIGDTKETEDILRQLKGRKYLIRGNHDKFLDDKAFDRSLFQWIEPYKEIKDNKRKVVLSHYPTFCYNGQYRLNDEGHPKAYMLYGHVHDSYDEILVNRFIRETRMSERIVFGSDEPQPIPCQMINCFCVYSDYVPLTLDQWIALDEERRKKME